jgi:hypothetical protein
VHAIEDKQEHGNLVAGKVLRSWDREALRAKLIPAITRTGQGVPEDRQMIALMLPIEAGHNRYLRAAARNTAAVGGKPYKFVVGQDAASQAVIDALTPANAMTRALAAATNVQDLVATARAGALAQATAHAPAVSVDAIDRLSKLADLHQRGVLTQEEFAVQKAAILSASM